jgi:aminoglycoside 3-N-acetyltransferase
MTELQQALTQIGIPHDSPVMVHSAFGSLAKAGYSATSLVEDLCDYFNHGTVLMPTFTWRTVTPANPVFDARVTPSETGYLTEYFRTHVATDRSCHPTHSVAVWGRDADYFTELTTDEAPCSINSPMGKLIEHCGWALLLGTDLNQCTILHCAEEQMAPTLYVSSQRECYHCTDTVGGVHALITRRHTSWRRNYQQFHELAWQGVIGGVPCLAVYGRLLYRRACDLLRVSSDALFEPLIMPSSDSVFSEQL